MSATPPLGIGGLPESLLRQARDLLAAGEEVAEPKWFDLADELVAEIDAAVSESRLRWAEELAVAMGSTEAEMVRLREQLAEANRTLIFEREQSNRLLQESFQARGTVDD